MPLEHYESEAEPLKDGSTASVENPKTASFSLVSEPDLQKIGKKGLVNEMAWKCTLRNFRNFISS